MQMTITPEKFEWLLNLWADAESSNTQRRLWEPDPALQDPDSLTNRNADLHERLADLEHRVRYPAAFCCTAGQ